MSESRNLEPDKMESWITIGHSYRLRIDHFTRTCFTRECSSHDSANSFDFGVMERPLYLMNRTIHAKL